MKKLNLIASATALTLASTAATADTFIGLTAGKVDSNFDNSRGLHAQGGDFDKALHKDATYGFRVGVIDADSRAYITYDNASNDYHSTWKVRQENLTASYDRLYPINQNGTSLFAGATLGATKLTNESKGSSRDSDFGYAAGVQAGVIQKVADNFSIEGGYKYLKHNASVEVSPHDGSGSGSAKLTSSSSLYLGLNYQF